MKRTRSFGLRFRLVERVLSSRSYQVLAAQHGGDALRSRRAELRVLYMSGYMDDEIVRRGLHDPNISFIQKPFTAENLAMQVRKVLDVL